MILLNKLEKSLYTDEIKLEDFRDIMQHTPTSDTHYLLLRMLIHQKLEENFPGTIGEDFDDSVAPNEIILDELIYTQLLAWLDVLGTVHDPTTTPSTEQKYLPIWDPETIATNFFKDTAQFGPLQWLARRYGHELRQGIVDEFLARTELKEVGRCMRDIATFFCFLFSGKGSSSSGGEESRLSQDVRQNVS